MKVLFSTDLHGHIFKYEKLKKIVTNDNIDVFIIGGDILPKFTSYIDQQIFILNFLNNFLKEFNKLNIPLLIDFGNDDMSCNYELFLNIINQYKNIYNFHLNKVTLNNIDFIGMNFVPDYPFALKDWCRIDNKDRGIDPLQFGFPLFSTLNGYERISNYSKWLNFKLSIEEQLNILPKPENNVIYLFHSPPRNLGLDITYKNLAVGSYAITNFLENNKCLCALCGHIHESPDMSGNFYNKSLYTENIVIQPGQNNNEGKLKYCIFNLNDIESTIKLYKK